MPEVIANPLGFWCAPNQATPDYVIYDDFRSWLAYGLMECWLGTNTDDPNSEVNMARPVTREDVTELRGYFLDLVETCIVSLWKEQYKPGDGSIDGDWQHLNIGTNDQDETMLTWYVRLDKDSMMFELDCTGSDAVCIWLSYEAIQDRQKVLAVLTEARQKAPGWGDDGNKVWPELVKLVEHPLETT